MSNINAITTDSDEFARQAMAYLESRGFKVTKEKLNFPIATYINKCTSVLTPGERYMINKVGKMEIDHILMAYRACESGKYKSPEQYLKDEYNDFTS